MKLLLINSASADPFCATYDGHNLSVSRVSEFNGNPKPQDKLINCLHSLAREFDLQKIDAVSVVTGPGSFTGIRVGLAIAKGISLALNKKIIPVTNFELTLNRLSDVEPQKKYCVLISGKMPEFYYEFMQNGKESDNGYAYISVILSEAKDLLVGDFDDEIEPKLNYVDLLNVRHMKTEPNSMLELSIKHYNKGKLYSPEQINPLYIKDFIVKKK